MPPFACSKLPGPGDRVGERPPFRAEQLGLQERLGKRTAVDRDEGPGSSPGGVVDEAGNKLLSGAALPEDQDGGLRGCVAHHELLHLAHAGALPDHPLHGTGARARRAPRVGARQGGAQGAKELGQLIGLHDVVAGARKDGLLDHARRSHGREHHHRRRQGLRGDVPQCRDAVHVGERNVQEHHVRPLAAGRLDSPARAVGGQECVRFGEHEVERLLRLGIIVDEEDFHHGTFSMRQS